MTTDLGHNSIETMLASLMGETERREFAAFIEWLETIKQKIIIADRYKLLHHFKTNPEGIAFVDRLTWGLETRVLTEVKPWQPNEPEKAGIDKVLQERGNRYGDFSDHAQICQDLKTIMQNTPTNGWNKLSPVQKQALEVIADKIARILSGDPNYDDNWIDIQGYAKLVQERLPVVNGQEIAR